MLVLTDESNDTLKNMKNYEVKIRDLIRSITNNLKIMIINM